MGEQKLQRVGAFPYSPEEGTPAARMLNRVDTEEAQRRANEILENAIYGNTTKQA